jgi:cobalt/nickel transport system permease protein
VLISAAAAALEIGLSGLISLQTVLVAMLSVHLPIALVEGLATVAVVRSIYQLRPDLVPGLEKTSSWEPVVRALALCSVGVVLLAVPLASSAPDGLESVAARLGFADASVSLLHAPFPEYELPNGSGFFARIGVALLGLLLVLVSSTALVRSLRQRSARVEG